MASNNVTYVGFWPRLLAALIDLALLWTGAVFVATVAGLIDRSLLSVHPSAGQDVLLFYLVPACIVIACWKTMHATPGKMAIGAKIVDAKTGNAPGLGQYAGRYAAYFLSILPAGLGLVWIGFDKKKRGWHDKLAGTVVVRCHRKIPVEAPSPEILPHMAWAASSISTEHRAPVSAPAIDSVNSPEVARKPARTLFGKSIVWGFIAFNCFMILLLNNLMGRSFQGSGVVIGIFAVVVFIVWLCGAALLGLIALLTRPKK